MTINRIIPLLLAGIVLTSCGQSQGEKFRRFAAYCLHAGFQPNQCLFLWDMAQNSASDQSQSFVTGMAIGLVAGQTGSSKGR